MDSGSVSATTIGDIKRLATARVSGAQLYCKRQLLTFINGMTTVVIDLYEVITYSRHYIFFKY